ncbi:MAG: hypothetical protein IPM77_14915 [Crocinitomicaceae bacterium]|nr:hypothetical protein [Crocinitomicaceae bacterium]
MDTTPTTQGTITEVVRSKNEKSGGYTRYGRNPRVTRFYPYAEFQHGDFIYTIQGPTYYDMESCPGVSDKVNIIYDPENPIDAKFLNLTGFWFNNYIWKILILLAFLILITTFIKKDQKIIFRYRRNPGEKIIEITVSEEQHKAQKIANWARSRMMFGKRKR